MTGIAKAFAEAAEALAGAPFCLRGRDPQTGLDCVGLVEAALSAAGGKPVPPRGYGLRNRDISGFLAFANASGFSLTKERTAPGDLLLVSTGPLQEHLLVALAGDRFVHAHAGLRRVVVTNALPNWPILLHWRIAPGD